MDIVEFIEKVCEFPLMEWQKEFIRKTYEAVKNDKQMIYIPRRRDYSRFHLRTLQALTIIAVAKERGLVKLDSDKEEKE